MYKKKTYGWLKRIDYVLLDVICIQIAFYISNVIIRQDLNPYSNSLYRNLAIFLVLADVLITVMFETYKNILSRGYYLELAACIKQGIMLILACSLYLFASKEGFLYSRLALFVMCGLYVVITYVFRLLWKKWLRHMMRVGESASLVIITTADKAPTTVTKIKNNNLRMYKLSGLIIVDEDRTGETIEGVEVIADVDNGADALLQMWVDEVYIDVDSHAEFPTKLVECCSEMGLTIHFDLHRRIKSNYGKQYLETMGEITVLTKSLNYMTYRQACIKRMIDILGGLAGCIATILLTLIIGPIIYIKSPGPIFFSQERVGKNGKLFKMYKFRSMYLDAEEKKAELMKHNKMDNDLMFKLDFDPRIIGNIILPDGTKKTGIGQFIRSTSLDEFPQFFNVLLGQMSLVGYRPALPSEYEQYKYHHRVRICAKPGITGMWQANGRSEITDFEEVVRLDKEYIQNWSMGLDFRILFKTAIAVLTRKGSM